MPQIFSFYFCPQPLSFHLPPFPALQTQNHYYHFPVHPCVRPAQSPRVDIRLFCTEDIWDSADAERSLLGASFIWLKEISEKWDHHKFPLWGRRETKIPLLGEFHSAWRKWKDLHEQTPSQMFSWSVCFPKIHLSFLKKPACSSYRSLFPPLPFPLLSEVCK